MGRVVGWIAEAADRLSPAIVVVAVAAVLILGAQVMLRSDDPRRSRWMRSIALAAVIGIILVATLGTRDEFGAGPDLKLVPFADLVRALLNADRSTRGALIELLANVVLFVPFGLTLKLRFPALSLGRVAAISFALSFVIETLQLLLASGRVANVTDVLTNTLGGVLGAALLREPTEAVPDA